MIKMITMGQDLCELNPVEAKCFYDFTFFLKILVFYTFTSR